MSFKILISAMLNKNIILLDQKINSKETALQKCFELFYKNDYIEKSYSDSISEREKISSSYLGNGIAIPHGLTKDISLVKKTGICIIQVPKGITWINENKVFLIIGMVSTQLKDYTLILKKINYIIRDFTLCQKLFSTKDIETFLTLFQFENLKQDNSTLDTKIYKHQKQVKIISSEGLHARPVNKIVEFVSNQTGDFAIAKGHEWTKADSITKILSLGIQFEDKITIGADTQSNLNKLEAFILQDFDGNQKTSQMDSSLTFVASKNAMNGFKASLGIGIGRAFVLQKKQIPKKTVVHSIAKEIQFLDNVLFVAVKELEILKNSLSEKESQIFSFHQALLKDEEILEKSYLLIKSGKTASEAFSEVIDEQIGLLESSNNQMVKARILDYKDIKQRVLSILSDDNEKIQYPKEPFILIAEELTPSQTADLPREFVQGILTICGGANSHTSLIAKSFGIPCLVGMDPRILDLKSTDFLIVNGNSGFVECNPDEAILQTAKDVQNQITLKKQNQLSQSLKPAFTKDKVSVKVMANVNTLDDLEKFSQFGADGIGLFRTETFFQNFKNPPTFQDYEDVFQKLNQTLKENQEVVFRAFDIGADKPVDFIEMKTEKNPFLGVRGIRLMYEYRDIFLTQLRAIFRLKKNGLNVKIMIPMVTNLQDVLFAEKAIQEAKLLEKAPNIEFGIMVEVPSVVMSIECFADKVDFVSIGTNDLTQYLLAMDRMNPLLMEKASEFEPSILKSIQRVVDVMSKQGKKVSVCGSMASDPLGAKVLLGLGVDSLSVSVSEIPSIKDTIRNLSLVEVNQLSQKACCSCKTVNEITNLF